MIIALIISWIVCIVFILSLTFKKSPNPECEFNDNKTKKDPYYLTEKEKEIVAKSASEEFKGIVLQVGIMAVFLIFVALYVWNAD